MVQMRQCGTQSWKQPVMQREGPQDGFKQPGSWLNVMCIAGDFDENIGIIITSLFKWKII